MKINIPNNFIKLASFGVSSPNEFANFLFWLATLSGTLTSHVHGFPRSGILG